MFVFQVPSASPMLNNFSTIDRTEVVIKSLSTEEVIITKLLQLSFIIIIVHNNNINVQRLTVLLKGFQEITNKCWR